jgi:oligopeptide transport system substrate-binding protein
MMAAALQSMWKEIGVVVEVQLNDSTAHYNALREGDFELAFVGWLADIPDPYSFLSALFSDAGPYMKTGYISQVYDDLMRRALEAWDPITRADTLARAEQHALDDVALAPLLFDTARDLVSPRIVGFQESQFNVHPARWIDFDLSRPSP